MHDVAVRVRAPELLDPPAVVLAPLVGAREVPDRGFKPDVEVLLALSRDAEPEIRRIPRDVPVAQRLGEPLVDEVADLRLQAPLAAGPSPQPLLVLRQFHEVMRRAAPLEVRVSADGAARVLQIRRLVGAPAILAGVAVLVLRAAHRALAADVTVGQESLVDAAVHLQDVALLDGPVRAQGLVDAPRVVLVLR